jgi:hypothetical protein
MLADVVVLDERRSTPRPTAAFQATTDGCVELTVRFDDGTSGIVHLSPEQAAQLILQGTDAVELAEEIGRRG